MGDILKLLVIFLGISFLISIWYIVIPIFIFCVFVAIIFDTLKQKKKKQKERMEKERKAQLLEELRENYGYNEQVQSMIHILNQIFKLNKYHLTKEQKSNKLILKKAYEKKLYELGCGYVYFVKENGTGTIKIGKADRPLERIFDGFGVKIPFELELIHLIKCKDPYATESFFHKIYDSKRINGEWFKLTDDDVFWIKDAKYDLNLYRTIVGFNNIKTTT